MRAGIMAGANTLEGNQLPGGNVHSRARQEWVGRHYGRLTVIEDLGMNASRQRRLVCECECGNTAIVQANNLASGHTKSCRCLRTDDPTTHGMARHPLYATWRGMLLRCTYTKHRSFPGYGGRGISVHAEWLDDPTAFIEWIEANLGPRPEGYTLDRIDVDGHYEPSNLRWADWSTQNANRQVEKKP